jgi:hypothetical protein
VLLDLIKKTKQTYVLLMLADYLCLCYCKFWSLEIQRNTWHFCINCEFLGENWVPKHITIGLFETLGQTLVRNVQDLIKLYGYQKLSLFMWRMKDHIWIPWQLFTSQ